MVSLESWVVGQFYITLDTKPIGETLTAEEGLIVKKWFESAYKDIIELATTNEIQKLKDEITALEEKIEELEDDKRDLIQELEDKD